MSLLKLAYGLSFCRSVAVRLSRILLGLQVVKSKPTTAAEHFLSSPNPTANDMQVIPIEKIFSNRDSIRKAKEAFLISKGRTLVPHGLNIREETY